MQGLVVEKERNKTRINSRTWVYNVDRGTQGEAVKVKAEKKNDIYLASKTEIQSLDLDREYGKVVRFAEKLNICLSDEDSVSQRDMLSLLLYMGRKAAVKKLLTMKRMKMMRYMVNPFLLYLDGVVDFHTARVISLRTLLPFSLRQRVQAYLYHVLEEAYRNGRESISFIDAVFELSSMMDEDEDKIEGVLKGIRDDKKLKGKKRPHINDRVYLAWIYFLKLKALKLLEENGVCETFEVEDDNIRKLLSHRHTILTGGPGTGKTTLLRKIKELFGDRCILTGLTGKAAQNLGENAVTVHSLLGYGPRGFSIRELDCEVLVVDEASMLNWQTLYAILRSARRVIFAGDPGQLPPVEGESVFRVMMERLPVVELTKVWRFRENHSIEVIRKESEKKIFVELNRLINLLKRKEFQVITPIHGGLLGTSYLNEYMQKVCNSETVEFDGIKRGDRVIVNQNVYTPEKEFIAANGSVGVVEDIDKLGDTVYCLVSRDGDRVLLKREHVELAYALTVHRYQGSECDHVIFILPDRKKVREDFITEEMIRVGKTRGRVRTYILEVA